MWWFAPFFSGGGYSSEAVEFALALHASPVLKRDGLWITQHGDAIKRGVLQVTPSNCRLETLTEPSQYLNPS